MRPRTIWIFGLSAAAGAVLTFLGSPEWSSEHTIDIVIVGFGAFGMGLFGVFTADWWGEPGLQGMAKSLGAGLVAGMGGACMAMVLAIMTGSIYSVEPRQLLVAPITIILGFYFLLFLLFFLFPN